MNIVDLVNGLALPAADGAGKDLQLQLPLPPSPGSLTSYLLIWKKRYRNLFVQFLRKVRTEDLKFQPQIQAGLPSSEV